jgi:hypothetical protein
VRQNVEQARGDLKHTVKVVRHAVLSNATTTTAACATRLTPVDGLDGRSSAPGGRRHSELTARLKAGFKPPMTHSFGERPTDRSSSSISLSLAKPIACLGASPAPALQLSVVGLGVSAEARINPGDQFGDLLEIFTNATAICKSSQRGSLRAAIVDFSRRASFIDDLHSA